MADKLKVLAENGVKRTNETRVRAMDVIDQLVAKGKKVNFNSVHVQSGISKSFLYRDEETRKRIEERRSCDIDNEMNRRAKYDKTSRSKDVIIQAKDKRIAKIEAQNQMLQMELEHLRGLIYTER